MKLIPSGGSGKTPLLDHISECNHMVLLADSTRRILHLQGGERKC